MKKLKLLDKNGFDKEYFLSTKNSKNEIFIYASDSFKLSEIDLINLIKICLIESRNKAVGKKILAIYRDSTEQRGKEVTKERLKMIGIEDEELPKPTKSKDAKFK